MNDLPPAPVSNIPEYSVSEISSAVKRTLERDFGRVRVRGEVTELKRYPSGHLYFSLKDDGGKIAGVVWKYAAARLGMDPENGVEVIATGKVSSYGERSNYQLIVERMEYAGAGALLARIEALRLKLTSEGVFAADRKRKLPLLPVVIGVVTSAQGAVIEDIRTTIERRFPRHILLWSVPVQGEGAAARIAEAIAGFSALQPGGAMPRPDVLIVARGGGSLEDLMAFNDEAVVRAVAACTIPLISAVGHETDTTLIDHAADRRAPTPTAAAELAVPSRVELAADVLQKAARLGGALNRLAQEQRLRLQRAERGLPDPIAMVGTARQRVDDRGQRLDMALPNLLAMRRGAVERCAAALPDPTRALAAARQAIHDRAHRLDLALPLLVAARRPEVTLAGSRLEASLRHTVAGRAALAARVMPRLGAAPVRARLREARARLDGIGGRLESVSHHAVLARGYSAVFDAHGHLLATAAAVKPGATLRITFADGSVNATAERGDRRQHALPL